MTIKMAAMVMAFKATDRRILCKCKFIRSGSTIAPPNFAWPDRWFSAIWAWIYHDRWRRRSRDLAMNFLAVKSVIPELTAWQPAELFRCWKFACNVKYQSWPTNVTVGQHQSSDKLSASEQRWFSAPTAKQLDMLGGDIVHVGPTFEAKDDTIQSVVKCSCRQ